MIARTVETLADQERETHEQIARLKRRRWELECKSDLSAWAIEALAPMEQTPAAHHRLMLDALAKVQRGEIKRLMINLPPGSAKALALDTPIPTPSGWTTIGTLTIGDEVFDECGQPCRVTWVSPVWKNRPVYTVRTDCGDAILADRDHEWLVALCRKPRKNARKVEGDSRFKIKETWQLVRRRSKRPMIQRALWLDCPEAALPVDPYLLGVWLGDGHSAGIRITSSIEDQPWLRTELGRLGYRTTNSSQATLFGVNGVRAAFVSLGLINDPTHKTFGRKHIPAPYLRGSRVQRLSLLQGLIDTDGTVCKERGVTTFCNTNRELAQGVQELARSLGVKASFIEGRATLYGKDCGPVYRVSFYLRDSARLPRKRAFTRDAKRTPNTYIDVEAAGFADTVCIEVDSPSHLFLCGRSMTPTHNSTYASKLFPPWFFAQKSNLDLIGVSHGSDLAEEFSGSVQGYIRQNTGILGYTLATENVKRWRTTNGGFYRAAGVGGSITGRRADGALIDDPVKGAAEAESPTFREMTWQWYQAELYTRLKPDAWIIVVMTRWSEDDLGGRLLKAAESGEGDQWTVLKMPAICDSIVDPLGRPIGAALWPEWQDEIALLGGTRPNGEVVVGIRTNVGEYVWGSLYQQDPKPRGASFFDIATLLLKIEKDGLTTYEPAPMPTRCDTIFAIVDTAIKSGQEHNSTAVTFCSYNSLTRPIKTLIVDWDIVQIEGADQAEWLPSVHARGEELAALCGARYGYSGAVIEDKATGTVLIQQSQNEARKLGRAALARAIDSKLTAMGKEERAIAAAPYIIAGEVKFAAPAFEKTKVHKGVSANHQAKQITDFRLGSKQKDGLDLLDTFCYAVLMTCAPNSGERKGI
jgi:hypothetical protein